SWSANASRRQLRCRNELRGLLLGQPQCPAQRVSHGGNENAPGPIGKERRQRFGEAAHEREAGGPELDEPQGDGVKEGGGKREELARNAVIAAGMFHDG